MVEETIGSFKEEVERKMATLLGKSIVIDEIGPLSVTSTPKFDKEEEEPYTVEKISFTTRDMELANIDKLREAGKLGKIVSVEFHIG